MTTVPPTFAGHCRRCGYALAGLAERRCPECGRPFDPASRRTFDRSPRRRVARRLVRCGVVLAVLAAVVASPVVWAYAGWRAERAAESVAGSALQVTYRRRIGPAWLGTVLGPRAYWLDRATALTIEARRSDPAWRTLGTFASAEYVAVADVSRGEPWKDKSPEKWPDDTDLAGLSNLTRVRNLSISRFRCTDETLATLGRMRELRSVGLEDLPQVTDAGFAALAGADRIQTLYVKNVPLGDDGLRRMNVAGKLQLTVVQLNSTNVGDAGVQMVNGLPQLEHLELIACPITDGVLVGIGRARHLQVLQISSPDLTGATLDNLAGLNQLQVLSLADGDLTDANLRRLPPLPALIRLVLDGKGLTTGGVSAVLPRVPSLVLFSTSEASAAVDDNRIDQEISARPVYQPRR